jgi:hypothetical protein
MAQLRHEMADVGPRVADWLRSNYRDSLAKRVAREFEVSERQAQRWASGERPTPEHISAMAAKWGWRFIGFIYQGVVGHPMPEVPALPAASEIHAKLDRLDQELAALRDDLRGRGS